MLRNFIFTSIRNLRKKLGFTLVNILGLAFGMATCLAIFLFVDYDLSYDSFQRENVYRIWLNRVYPEREVDYAFIPHSIGPQLVEDYPEVESQARVFMAFGTVNIQYGEDSFNEENVGFADSTLFDVFVIPLVSGDPETALKGQNSIVITESIAKKLFGNQEAVGKTLEVQGQSKMVTAVAKDYPANSHFEFNYLIPLNSIPFFQQPNWLGFSCLTYIKIQQGVKPELIEKRIPGMLEQYADGQMRARNGISYQEYMEAGNGYNYSLMNIRDIHLKSHIEGEIKANGNINYVYIFSIVAIFILFIACINFMNLSTARSAERAKEVGIRKVMGSAKSQLIGQFLTESVIIVFLSSLIAIGLTYVTLPYFGEIASRPLSLQQFASPIPVFSGIVIVLGIGFLAGLYPAFVLSSFSPVSVLKGKMRSSGAGVSLRNVLVVLQFTISIALISATLLVNRQMNYMLNKPLGFNEENIIVVDNAFAVNNDDNAINWSRFETFSNELEKIPNVESVAFTSSMPGDILQGYIVRVPGSGEKESMVTRAMAFGDNMASTMGMELTSGRFFSPEFNDSLNIILNTSAVEKLGINDPIGKKIINVVDGEDPDIEYTIVGVINDFHFQSLHNSMEPMVILSMESINGFINKAVLRVKPENINGTLSMIESKWIEFVPEAPFQSYFLDQNLEEFYTSEKATGRIFAIFMVLAIIIAAVGLLGLSAFIINQRVKEIGVRKVLGASIPSLLFLLSKDYLKLIFLATIIAVPIAYYWMMNWLDDFAYSAGISWSVFVIAGLIAVIIGLVTVSIQSIRTASANPVKSLRDE